LDIIKWFDLVFHASNQYRSTSQTLRKPYLLNVTHKHEFGRVTHRTGYMDIGAERNKLKKF
jgi:hypothetical protein